MTLLNKSSAAIGKFFKYQKYKQGLKRKIVANKRVRAEETERELYMLNVAKSKLREFHEFVMLHPSNERQLHDHKEQIVVIDHIRVVKTGVFKDKMEYFNMDKTTLGKLNEIAIQTYNMKHRMSKLCLNNDYLWNCLKPIKVTPAMESMTT